MLRFMPKTDTHERKFDMFGFALLAIALGALQFCLDRGQQNDWFSSWETIIEAGLAIGASWMFVVHMVTSKHPLFERAMFTDRNFATSLLFMAVTGVLLETSSCIPHDAKATEHEADQRAGRSSGIAHEKDVTVADPEFRHAADAQGVVADRAAEELERSLGVDRALQRPLDREGDIGDD